MNARIDDGRRSLLVRERLAASQPDQLREDELLALVLATGTPGADAQELARQLLDRFGGVQGLERTSLVELQQVAGIGPAKASRVTAALELGRRCTIQSMAPGQVIRSSQEVVREFGPRLAHLDREHFFAVLLDSKHRKIRDHCIAVGSLDSAIVHPREVFRPAVAAAAAAVIVVHNHPSGDPQPSGEDLQVTRRLVATAELIGIDLLDHVIVARHGCISLRDCGEIR
jgi:DNA repair protein RadC